MGLPPTVTVPSVTESGTRACGFAGSAETVEVVVVVFSACGSCAKVLPANKASARVERQRCVDVRCIKIQLQSAGLKWGPTDVARSIPVRGAVLLSENAIQTHFRSLCLCDS